MVAGSILCPSAADTRYILLIKGNCTLTFTIDSFSSQTFTVALYLSDYFGELGSCLLSYAVNEMQCNSNVCCLLKARMPPTVSNMQSHPVAGPKVMET